MSDISTAPYALVVDDDAVILCDACQILEEAGFRVLQAFDADEALPILERYEGDITAVFTDVEMPGSLNGFSLARVCAQRWPEVAVLVASGRREPRDDELPPVATFIRKPFSAGVVHARLQEMLPDGRKPEPLKQAR
jgi:CheY-like chemotaxis protein